MTSKVDTYSVPEEKLSRRNRLKIWLLEGNVINWKTAFDMWGERNLPQRIHQVGEEFEKEQIGTIEREHQCNPEDGRADRWTNYWLVKYTDEDKANREDTDT